MPEAWINLDSVKIGYEISFNKYFYRHKPLRSLEAITTDILQLEQQAEGLLLTDIAIHKEVQAVIVQLNDRPRKKLIFKAPAKVMADPMVAIAT